MTSARDLTTRNRNYSSSHSGDDDYDTRRPYVDQFSPHLLAFRPPGKAPSMLAMYTYAPFNRSLMTRAESISRGAKRTAIMSIRRAPCYANAVRCRAHQSSFTGARLSTRLLPSCVVSSYVCVYCYYARLLYPRDLQVCIPICNKQAGIQTVYDVSRRKEKWDGRVMRNFIPFRLLHLDSNYEWYELWALIKLLHFVMRRYVKMIVSSSFYVKRIMIVSKTWMRTD